ncbi:MAG: MCE family protein, partial [Prevotellaceae bacterium]|nr:MCE family protein [Prevotellaceae bacterium]
ASLETTTANLAQGSYRLKQVMNTDIPRILGNVDVFASDFKQLSGNLKKIDFSATVDSINYTIANLNLLTGKLNGSEGSLGLLLNDKDLYINLSKTASSANELLIDLQKSPKKYVHFSLFGRK